MQSAAIVPVKRIGAAKQRLSLLSGDSDRSILIGAMVGDVLSELGACAAVDRVIVVSGEPIAVELADRHGCILVDDPGDDGHSAAAAAGVRKALTDGCSVAALLPGDCPLIDAGELATALRDHPEGCVGVIPDTHGSGTNGLILTPPDAIEPAFGPGSHRRHLELARAAGHEARTVALDSLALDLDTPGDLTLFAALLDREPERAPRTARALAELGLAASEPAPAGGVASGEPGP